MQKPLLGHKIAFLVTNGFHETDLIEAQKRIQALGADTRIVSTDQGLVSSWNSLGWGLNFAADQGLKTSLAADYSGVFIPGGQRSIDKLQLTAHTRRFVRGFYESNKPVCVMNEGVDLLAFSELSVADSFEDGATVDKNLFVGKTDDEGRIAVIEAMSVFLDELLVEQEAVAA